MKKIYGYARVSTLDQNLDLQIDALNQANCTHVISDSGVSGATTSRPGLNKILKIIKPGDTLIVWRLDRLGRSLHYLIVLVENLRQNNIHFISLQESIDTSTHSGKLMFHILAVLAEFERELISERTRAGIASARAKGKQIGRRPALTSEQKEQALLALANQVSVQEVASRYSVSTRTIQRLKSQNNY